MEQGAPKGKLIVFSAPSGTGKSTIAKAVLGQIGELSFSVSATTRSKRPGEEEGVHYFFLDKKEFEKLIEKGGFIEFEYFFGNYYGTLLDKTREAIDSGRHLLLDLDVKGALNLKKLFPLDSLLLFIRPPSMAVLQERLLQRDGRNSPGLQERLERAELELGYAEQFDEVVVNDDLEQTVTAVTGIIRKYLTTL